MDAPKRRNAIMVILQQAIKPVTGTFLARELGVSRQIIVSDIAILRAAGESIYATPQGYTIPAVSSRQNITATIACRHGRNHLQTELMAIVDNGGKVLDVVVEHPIYGEMKANLMLASRRDVAEFIFNLEQSGAEPLSLVTGGVHIHTIEVPNVEALAIIEQELIQKGILIR